MGPAGREAFEESVSPGQDVDSVEGDSAGEEGSDALIGTFGLADELPMGDEVTGTTPDLGGPEGLRLAEGFAEAFGNDEVGLAREGSGPAEDSPGEDPPSGFVLSDEFVVETAEGSGVPKTAESELGDQGVPAQEVPDFGAEFAQMPGLDPEPGFSAPEDPPQGTLSDQDLLQDSGYGFVPEAEEEGQAQLPELTSGEGSGEQSGGDSRRYASNRLRPMSSRRPPPKKRFSPGLVAGIVAGLVIVTSAVGTAMGAFSAPGFGWLGDMFGEVPFAALDRPGPEPTDPILRFSLELLEYEEEELGIALEMRNTLRGRRPDLIFNLAPVESGGTVSYVLYAGPAADVVEAENLRAPISELFREDPESWPIRNTPRAFLLGTEGTLTDARRILNTYETSGALGYILQVSYPDGSVGYEVLSGAFQGTDDGRWWQMSLREAGFRDLPLVERRGKPPE